MFQRHRSSQAFSNNNNYQPPVLCLFASISRVLVLQMIVPLQLLLSCLLLLKSSNGTFAMMMIRRSVPPLRPATRVSQQQQQQQYEVAPMIHDYWNKFEKPSNDVILNKIKILKETDRYMAIYKPSGISHHDDVQEKELGILSCLRKRQQLLQDDNNNKQEEERYYGVHRLDKVTSGILLVAKDVEMAQLLSQAFRSKHNNNKNNNKNNDIIIYKYYIGVSYHKPTKKKQGWVRGIMKRGRRKSWYLTRQQQQQPKQSSKKKKKKSSSDMMTNKDSTSTENENNNNNAAVTRFFTSGLATLRPNDDDNNNTMESSSYYYPRTCLLFRPHTGKTHQLRVAAKSLGLPLIGDPIYRDKTMSAKQQQQQDDNDSSPTTTNNSCGSSIRTFLHATAIHIDLSRLTEEDDNNSNNNNTSEDKITIVSLPNENDFSSLLYPNQKTSQEKFQEVVIQLFQKYCECPEILETIMNKNKKNKNEE